jgi:hypothetical protein
VVEMTGSGLEHDVADLEIHERTANRFREAGIALPTFEQLAEPGKVPARIRDELPSIDPDAANPLNPLLSLVLGAVE